MRRSLFRRLAVALAVVPLLACIRPSSAAPPPAVQTWGANWYGGLGDGSTSNRRWAYEPPGWPPGATAVAGGNGHSLALVGGTVYAAGYNASGSIGDGTWTDRLVPVPVPGLGPVAAIAAGYYHSLALTANGDLWAWGYNVDGELGDGTANTRNVPGQVLTGPGSPLTGVIAIGAGPYHSLAVRVDGSVWACGWNGYGQLGDGTTTNSYYAIQVPNISTAVQVAAGYHSVALLSSGSVMAWGYNGVGALGDGTNVDRLVPVPMLDSPGGLPVIGVSDIAAGLHHTVLRRNDSSVWTCGYNPYGQLGDGTWTDRWNPVLVPGVLAASPQGVAAGDVHTLIRAPDGSAWAWGYGGYGQLGDGTWFYSIVPVKVWGITGVSAVGAGSHHSLAVADSRTATSLAVPDRTATMGETMTLRGYLKRLSDGAWMTGRSVTFLIDGSDVGSAMTDSNGRADLSWLVWGGAPTRTIQCEYGGEAGYQPCMGAGTAHCQTWTTKMVTFDRTARITDRTELKCRLLRSDNVPIYSRWINFGVDGTFVISRLTNVSGYASYPNYDVPDGAGAGVRPILSEWVGDSGYAAVSKTANLTVRKAIPYIWVLKKTVPHGGIANLYAYFRRLYDYQKQAGKTVDFKVDGTLVQTVMTDAGGVARYLYPTVEPVGEHTITCEFAGDAWLDAGSGSAGLTIY